jgi:hypothetical protein
MEVVAQLDIDSADKAEEESMKMFPSGETGRDGGLR